MVAKIASATMAAKRILPQTNWRQPEEYAPIRSTIASRKNTAPGVVEAIAARGACHEASLSMRRINGANKRTAIHATTGIISSPQIELIKVFDARHAFKKNANSAMVLS
jgi:hypothetical protein